MLTFGYPQSQWDAAKQEALAILSQRARREQTIAYSELAAQIAAIHFSADQHAFHELLGQISEDEDAAGRGMISVLVVYKPPAEQKPGPGFYKLAAKLHRTEHDKDRLWINEFHRVVAAHSGG
ncbi:MAG: hypothetical protein AAB403_11545 [Planctomycetota bacterium]